jgi:hypothetical protein
MKWASRVVVLMTLMLVYGAGFAGGRDYCLRHPAVYPNLKP